MIRLTDIGGREILINPGQIESIELRPEPFVTMTSGKIWRVRESLEEIFSRISASTLSISEDHPITEEKWTPLAHQLDF